MVTSFQPESDEHQTAATADLRRLGALMCFVVAIGGGLAELLVAWVWLSPSMVETLVLPHIGLATAAVALDGWTRFLGFLASMLPLLVLFYALHQAYELFDGYRRGKVFSTNAPVRLRRIGICMITLAALRPLANTMLGLILTASSPPGHRIFALGFSIEDYMIAAFGGLILAIAHVMLAAARLSQEHQQIV